MKIFLLAMLAICTTGCVSIKPMPLDTSKVASLNGRSVSVTFRQRPSFVAMTPTKAMFGGFGAAAMISAGNTIVDDNAIKDPSRTIARRLANGLAQKYGVQVAQKVVATESDKREDLIALGPDLVLDVMTTGWSFMYFPTNWSQYRVAFSSRAILIDSKSSTVLAEGFCNRMAATDDHAPTYDDLLNNNAAKLKTTLSDYGDQCADEFMSKTFHL